MTAGQMLDLHQPMQADNVALVPWLLTHCPKLEAITLESEPATEGAVLREVLMLRSVLTA